MKVNYLRSYKNKKGHTVFVYGVTGSEAQLASYKEAQGEFYREDDESNPIWFSSKFVGDTAKLIITSNGKVVADTSEFDKAASMVAQYGGNLGNALANAFASKLMGHPIETQSIAAVNQPVDSADKLD